MNTKKDSRFDESPLENDENQVDLKEFKEMHEVDKIQSKANFFENENTRMDFKKKADTTKHIIQDVKQIEKFNRQIFSHNDALNNNNNSLINEMRESTNNLKQSEEVFEVVEMIPNTYGNDNNVKFLFKH